MQIGLVLFSDRRMGNVYRELLGRLFGDALTLRVYALDEERPQWSGDDCARVVFSPGYPVHTFGRVPTDKPLIRSTLAFRKEGLRRLDRFPPGTRALLVSTSYRTAKDAIFLLHANRVNNIEFFPCYPGSPPYRDIHLAITPGEPQLAPPGMTQVINIGDRVPDVQSMIEIAALAGLEHKLAGRRFREYDESVTGSARDVATPLLRSSRLRREYDTVMNMVEIGIIGIDEKNVVCACNRKAEILLGKRRSDILYLNIAEILPNIPLGQANARNAPLSFRHEKAGNLPLSITVTPMRQDDSYTGAMLMLLPAGEDEAFKTELVSKFMQKGHRARYTFAHITGESGALKGAVALAKKFADVDSSVLITGESGTGKEMFAHSIHNASGRFNKPFVAINCAAIPDDLLESELFGYEGGAFTGARKQGKTGLFEVANRGTIFLDEIEELSPALQAKLLRVIQERQVMRVGGDSVIPIDVRIISAANQDLPGLVKSGRFRRDLYYRINTLPVTLPPLRDRGDDIFLILEELCGELNASFVLSPEAKQRLADYPWPGNVRELRNCVEYLRCLKTRDIGPEDLPAYLGPEAAGAAAPGATEPGTAGTAAQEGPPPASNETLLARAAAIQEKSGLAAGSAAVRAAAAVLNDGPCGRRALAEKLTARGFPCTEAQARALLETMKAKGWVESPVGRSGSRLTAAGREALCADSGL